jgi:hypothetical protein
VLREEETHHPHLEVPLLLTAAWPSSGSGVFYVRIRRNICDMLASLEALSEKNNPDKHAIQS